ncbi:MAG: hypothetical protein H7335_05275 [Massilia sp.]|nr:hypothetical protein [Massilia sp.]
MSLRGPRAGTALNACPSFVRAQRVATAGQRIWHGWRAPRALVLTAFRTGLPHTAARRAKKDKKYRKNKKQKNKKIKNKK